MNRGLYALAGASATATAAAWANRLLEPMTNVSNVYFELSRAAAGRGAAWSWWFGCAWSGRVRFPRPWSARPLAWPWFGMAWAGAVWFGMVWFGMAWLAGPG